LSTLALAMQLDDEGQAEKAMALYQELVSRRNELDAESHKVLFDRLLCLALKLASEETVLDTLSVAVEVLGGIDDLETARHQVHDEPESLDKIAALATAPGVAPNALFGLAELFVAAQRFNDAQQCYRNATNDPTATAAERILDWGLSMFLAEQYEAAGEAFQLAIERSASDDDRLQVEYYQCAALEMAGRTEDALAVARKLAEAKPTSAEFAAREAWILMHADRSAEAIAAYEKLIADFDHSKDDITRHVLQEARIALSTLYVDAGKPAASAELLAQVLDEFPEHVGAMNDLGYLWADQGIHLTRSRSMIERAVAAEPDNAAYRDSLGWVLFRQGDYSQAVHHLEAALTQVVESSDGAGSSESRAPDPIILDHLGDAYLRAGRHDDAVGAWKQALPLVDEDQTELANSIRTKLAEHDQPGDNLPATE
jgi:tetratricopeptide (TPR) repeat protein